MQNYIGDIAGHRDRDLLTDKEDEVDSEGRNEREAAKEKETANRGYGGGEDCAVISLAQQCKSMCNVAQHSCHL